MSETINAAVAVTTETITATVTTGSETITVDVNVAARGPEGGTSGGGASDVSQLTTTGLAALNMLRVKTAGGLEARTPAQVLADIGAATTAQGGLADSAVQPGDLATASVGTSAALVFGDTVHAVSMSYIDDIATFTFGTAAAAAMWTALGGGGTITVPTLTGYAETAQSNITLGATATLSLAGGTILTATLTSATACTLTMPAVVAGKSFLLYLRQPASGTPTTAAWAASPAVVWSGGTAPTITATLGRQDIISFVADQAGAKWFGSCLPNFVY